MTITKGHEIRNFMIKKKLSYLLILMLFCMSCSSNKNRDEFYSEIEEGLEKVAEKLAEGLVDIIKKSFVESPVNLSSKIEKANIVISKNIYEIKKSAEDLKQLKLVSDLKLINEQTSLNNDDEIIQHGLVLLEKIQELYNLKIEDQDKATKTKVDLKDYFKSKISEIEKDVFDEFFPSSLQEYKKFGIAKFAFLEKAEMSEVINQEEKTNQREKAVEQINKLLKFIEDRCNPSPEGDLKDFSELVDDKDFKEVDDDDRVTNALLSLKEQISKGLKNREQSSKFDQNKPS